MNAVILAGGSGQRFWPLSRELSPKQLLSVFGTESLIVQSVRRVLPYVDDGDVTVVTGERLLDELRNHLSAQPDHAFARIGFIMEPMPKNTAPAIALAAAVLQSHDPDAVMIVLPSDHLLEDSPDWAEALETGHALAEAGFLVTIGITPTRVESGYGYIRGGDPIPGHEGGRLIPLKAKAFIEKPRPEVASEYVASGEYYWNAGIFVMRAETILTELRGSSQAGELIAETCEWLASHLDDPASASEARDRFSALPSVAIDVAVMEQSSRVAVIPAPLAWSDVGSLLALEKVAEADPLGVVRVGRGVDIDSEDTIVYSSDRLVATLGVHDLIVVDTSDATLVTTKERAQDVRLVFDALRAMGADEVTQPKVSLRPWGSWTRLLQGPGFQIKLLEIKPGAKPSLQRHRHRSEHWVVVSGTALVTIDESSTEVHVNEGVFIPVGSVHRIENQGKVLLRVIEVQVGEYLGEDDIVRLEDDWHRESI